MMVMQQRVALLLTLAALAGPACIESNPQPSPGAGGEDATIEPASGRGTVDEDRIYLSALDESNTIIIVGEAGAAKEAEGVYAAASDEETPPAGDPEDSANGGGDVDEDGSFVVVVPEVAPPTVRLTFTFPDVAPVVVDLPLPVPEADDAERPWLSAGTEDAEDPGETPPSNYDGWETAAGAGEPGITVTDVGSGMVEVMGGFLSVTPLARVVVVNLSLNEEAVVLADNSGQFLAYVPGQSGDGLSLFAVNPGDNTKATKAMVLSVP